MAISVRLLRAAAITSGGSPGAGDQDFVVTASPPGVAPKAAIVTVSGATSNAVHVPGAMLSFGIIAENSPGVYGQFCISSSSEDVILSANTKHVKSNTKVVFLLLANGTTNALATGTFITNGIRLNWSDFPATAVFVTVQLFFDTAADLSVYAGDFNPSTSIDTATAVSVGISPYWQPDQLIVLGAFGTYDTIANDSILQIGFADRGSPIRQCSSNLHGVFDASNNANSVQRNIVSDAYVTERAFGTVAHEITAFSATGFTTTTRIGTTTVTAFPYLALAYNSTCNHWVGVVNSPVLTGAQTVTAPNFKPQFVMQLVPAATLLSTTYAPPAIQQICDDSAEGAGTYGIAAFNDRANEIFSNSTSDDDAAAAMVTRSRSSDDFRCRADAVPYDLYVAITPVFIATGWTLTYSVANANVRFWPSMVWGEFVGGGGVAVPATSTIACAFAVVSAAKKSAVATGISSAAFVIAGADTLSLSAVSAIPVAFAIVSNGVVAASGASLIPVVSTVSSVPSLALGGQSTIGNVFTVVGDGSTILAGQSALDTSFAMSAVGVATRLATTTVPVAFTVAGIPGLRIAAIAGIANAFSIGATSVGSVPAAAIIGNTFTIVAASSVTYAGVSTTAPLFTIGASPIGRFAATSTVSLGFSVAAVPILRLGGQAAIPAVFAIAANSFVRYSVASPIATAFTTGAASVLGLGGTAIVAPSFAFAGATTSTHAALAIIPVAFTTGSSAIASFKAATVITNTFAVASIASGPGDVPGTWNPEGAPRRYVAADNLNLSFALEVYMRASAGRVNARLYDETATAAVAGSDLFTESSAMEYRSTAALPLIDGHWYRAQSARSIGGAGEIQRAAPVLV